MTAPLVGLVGKKRAGKDTFARRLVEHHGFTRCAFADPLKRVALRIDPIVALERNGWFNGFERLSEVVRSQGWEWAKGHAEVRGLLQDLGVAIREEVGPDAWVDRVWRDLAVVDGPVVITDVRFTNEADAVQVDPAGVLVRIHRSTGGPADSHVSETELDRRIVDHHVDNGGTIEDLEAAADDLAAVLQRR